jgi:hypothetical protein
VKVTRSTTKRYGSSAILWLKDPRKFITYLLGGKIRAYTRIFTGKRQLKRGRKEKRIALCLLLVVKVFDGG